MEAALPLSPITAIICLNPAANGKLMPRSAAACATINHEAETRYPALALEPPARSPRSIGSENGERCVSPPPDSSLRRRLLVLRLAGTGLAAPMTGALAQGRKAPTTAEPELPGKNDAPPEPRRSGETDADPGDEPGNGRGAAGGGRSLGATDADPGDEPGRGCAGNGVTDADPGDPPWQGRGGAPPEIRTGSPPKKR